MERLFVMKQELPQTNLKNPNPWQMEKRFDGIGDPYYNKKTRQYIKTPHVHDTTFKGGIRKANKNELPSNFR